VVAHFGGCDSSGSTTAPSCKSLSCNLPGLNRAFTYSKPYSLNYSPSSRFLELSEACSVVLFSSGYHTAWGTIMIMGMIIILLLYDSRQYISLFPLAFISQHLALLQHGEISNETLIRSEAAEENPRKSRTPIPGRGKTLEFVLRHTTASSYSSCR